MRTTLDLPDGLFRQVKAKAALEGATLKGMLTRYIESGLREPARLAGGPARRSRLPAVPKRGRGVIPDLTPQVQARLEEEEDLPSSTDLLDVNVWLALAAEAHVHHGRAKVYWDTEAASVSAFCRPTQLAFLRHLTNRTIMGDQMLSPSAAWKKLQEFLALPEVRYLAEPAGLDEQLEAFCNVGRTSPNLWSDAYLAAFARCAGLRLVTFDHGFSRFRELELLILKPEG